MEHLRALAVAQGVFPDEDLEGVLGFLERICRADELEERLPAEATPDADPFNAFLHLDPQPATAGL